MENGMNPKAFIIDPYTRFECIGCGTILDQYVKFCPLCGLNLIDGKEILIEQKGGVLDAVS
jgi:rRNA maturation endonuclease Nob1